MRMMKVFSQATRLNHYISCVWIFLHFPLQLYWLLQILQLSSFSWLFLGEKNTFPNLITSEIKLQFRAIYKMLNRTLKVKFLHKMLRDLLQYVQQFLATSHESAAVSTSSCAQVNFYYKTNKKSKFLLAPIRFIAPIQPSTQPQKRGSSIEWKF